MSKWVFYWMNIFLLSYISIFYGYCVSSDCVSFLAIKRQEALVNLSGVVPMFYATNLVRHIGYQSLFGVVHNKISLIMGIFFHQVLRLRLPIFVNLMFHFGLWHEVRLYLLPCKCSRKPLLVVRAFASSNVFTLRSWLSQAINRYSGFCIKGLLQL